MMRMSSSSRCTDGERGFDAPTRTPSVSDCNWGARQSIIGMRSTVRLSPVANKRRDVSDGASILLKTRNRDAIVDLSAITLIVLTCMPCRSLESVSSSSTCKM